MSRWSTRVVLFAVGLILTAFFAHRLLGMPTPVAANLFFLALAAATLAIALAALASITIWRTGRPGTARVMFGAGLGVLILAIPVVIGLAANPYPVINDITTDTVAPPSFTTLAAARPPGSNSAAYPGARFAEEQARAYPDIKPLGLARSSEEAFELVVEALKRLKMQIVRQEPPAANGQEAGTIEAVDRTLIMGFYDDVAIRVSGDENTARIDMRSASRFGRSDLGRNADRLRLLAHEIQMRVDATLPEAVEERAQRKKEIKRGKDGDPRQEPRRRSQDRAQ